MTPPRYDADRQAHQMTEDREIDRPWAIDVDPECPSTITVGEHLILVHCHLAAACTGPACPIHRPTDHWMRAWPASYTPGVGFTRTCQHGLKHRDPDSLSTDSPSPCARTTDGYLSTVCQCGCCMESHLEGT